jgi:hypothetical protein
VNLAKGDFFMAPSIVISTSTRLSSKSRLVSGRLRTSMVFSQTCSMTAMNKFSMQNAVGNGQDGHAQRCACDPRIQAIVLDIENVSK